MSATAIETPILAQGKGTICDASPMYDRAAIARSMSLAETDEDADDVESDVAGPVSGVVWPSARLGVPTSGDNLGDESKHGLGRRY